MAFSARDSHLLVGKIACSEGRDGSSAVTAMDYVTQRTTRVEPKKFEGGYMMYLEYPTKSNN